MLEFVGKFLSSAIWAITPEMLSEIYRIYDLHAAGGKPDLAAIEAQLGRPLTNDQPKEYETIDGVAVIPITGVISKRMDLFMQISGGASIERITGMVKSALADHQVKAITFVIDSPGGFIDGVFELAGLIHDSRDEKPCIAVAYGCAASAAYLLAAACDKVYASDIATVVGSIGVVATHRDTSKKDASSGIVTTEIYRGKYKRIVTDGPLTEEGKASMEEKVDYYYSLFINEVARFRGATPETVLSTMSTDVKDHFIGQQAVDAGLVDGIEPLDTIIQTLSARPSGSAIFQGTTLKMHKEEAAMKDIITTVAELKAAYPELAAQLVAEGVSSVDVVALETAAAGKERDRITGILAIAVGEEAGPKIKAIVESGITAAQYQAVQTGPIIGAAKTPDKEEALKTQLLTAITTQTGAPAVGADGKPVTAIKDYMALVEEYQKTEGCSRAAASKAVVQQNPKAHKEWLGKLAKERGG